MCNLTARKPEMHCSLCHQDEHESWQDDAHSCRLIFYQCVVRGALGGFFPSFRDPQHCCPFLSPRPPAGSERDPQYGSLCHQDEHESRRDPQHPQHSCPLFFFVNRERHSSKRLMSVSELPSTFVRCLDRSFAQGRRVYAIFDVSDANRREEFAVTNLVRMSAMFSSVEHHATWIRPCCLQPCKVKSTSTCLCQPCPCRPLSGKALLLSVWRVGVSFRTRCSARNADHHVCIR